MTNNQFGFAPKSPQRLSASDIHQLTSDTLKEHFELDMDGRHYQDQDIWNVVIAASAEHTTIETTCGALDGAPSPNTVRTALNGVLPDDDHLSELECVLNETLVDHLPKKVFRKSLPAACDVTALPYHGKHSEDDDNIKRGRAKSGTTHFHCYATLYIVKSNKRYTVALTLVRQSDNTEDILSRLLERAKEIGLRIKRLYLDREFDNNGVIAFLKKQSFPSIIPLTIRGKSGGTRALLKGRKSNVTTYTRNSSIYGPETFTVHVACKYSKGRYNRRGLFHFAYIAIGKLRLTPQQIYEEYRYRFGIETSYRLMNQVRARTTAKSAALRLFYVGIAFTMLNLWSYVKWKYLSTVRRGRTITSHHLLTLTRWRFWLWEVIKKELSLTSEIVIQV